MNIWKGGKPVNRECEKDGNSSKVKRLLLLILLILLILTISTVIIFFLIRINSDNAVIVVVPNENISGGVGLVIDPDAENSMLSENDNTPEQGVAISGYSSMTIPANTDKITVDFYNPEENAEMYYLTFEFRLYNDNGQDYEVLYNSGLVEPGKHIEQITLSHGLEKGKYDAVIHVQPYRMNEEKTLTNNADMRIALIVK